MGLPNYILFRITNLHNTYIEIGMDQKEFAGPAIQRVFQYLRRQAAGENLDHFSFSETNRVEGNVPDCLDMIIG